LRRLDAYMMDIGFMTKYKITIKVPKTRLPGFPSGTSTWCGPTNTPKSGTGYPKEALQDKLLEIRLQLRAMGEESAT
jgi:hypothetical protein